MKLHGSTLVVVLHLTIDRLLITLWIQHQSVQYGRLVHFQDHPGLTHPFFENLTELNMILMQRVIQRLAIRTVLQLTLNTKQDRIKLKQEQEVLLQQVLNLEILTYRQHRVAVEI